MRGVLSFWSVFSFSPKLLKLHIRFSGKCRSNDVDIMPISITISKMILSCFGHVCRMDSYRLRQIMLHSQLLGDATDGSHFSTNRQEFLICLGYAIVGGYFVLSQHSSYPVTSCNAFDQRGTGYPFLPNWGGQIFGNRIGEVVACS